MGGERLVFVSDGSLRWRGSVRREWWERFRVVTVCCER